MTRHESRVTGDPTSGFTVNYNAEMAKASGKRGPMVTELNWNYITNTACHSGGRVWILWKHNKLDVVLIDMDAQFIHVSVTNKLDGSQFFATFVYAFNKLEDMDEEMLPFRSTVALCDLQDIKSTGAFFTWNNKQPSETRIFSRIDRVLPEGSFDHCPCLVSSGGECQGRRKPFKFFNMWTKVPDFQSIVLTGWNTAFNGTAMFRIVKKLKLLKSNLKRLNRGLFSNIERNADVAYKLLVDCQLSLQKDKSNKELMDKERELRQSYYMLAAAREDFLRQKANSDWVKDGDTNSAMFHQDPDEVLNSFVEYYEELMGTKGNPTPVLEHIIRQGPLVYESEWEDLCRIPTEQEIRATLFSIPEDKSPGPDGYTSGFFKPSWDIAKGDICEAVKNFFENGALLKQVNCTTLVLLPKVDNPVSVREFRPIFIKLIMACVSTTSFSIALNGFLHGFFPGKRGLRQGDPISPLLFTLCMEYLSRLLNVVTTLPGFHFHPLCKQMKLSHLMFADDLLLFCKGDVQSIFIIMETFKRFFSASGLSINSEKSDFYCNGISQTVIHRVLQGTGFKSGQLPFKYLGVKISHKRLTKIDCNILVDRMIARIRGWNSRKISYSGRLILVKFVLSTIHNYWSQIFVLPAGIMDRIQALCRTFLWEGTDTYSKSPLVSWNVLCMDKKQEGLGLTDSKLWNYAAIGKLVWWIASKQDHLWIKWVDHIYLKGTPWFHYEPTNYSSWAWRKVCQIKSMFQSGYINGLWQGDAKDYTIVEGYKWLQSTAGTKVPWFTVVWNRYNVPKWNFTMWLVQHERLLTLDRLRKWGMAVPSECFICGQASRRFERERRKILKVMSLNVVNQDIARGEQEASRKLVFSELYQASKQTSEPWIFEPEYPGKSRIFDGRTGDLFEQPVIIGNPYILKFFIQSK
ncbi:uncharacterized protein LOC141627584 [Silene latifolia]|uniref:uncharacterized protein LOC141627584 n=1 Tax=Silene latifolia TaxID=37657 RepID=UPI003D784463